MLSSRSAGVMPSPNRGAHPTLSLAHLSSSGAMPLAAVVLSTTPFAGKTAPAVVGGGKS